VKYTGDKRAWRRRRLVEPRKEQPRASEEAFYEPFATFLQEDLEDATLAISLGGNKFRDKWGRRDVIGKKERTLGAATSSRRLPMNSVGRDQDRHQSTHHLSQLGCRSKRPCAYLHFQP